MQINRFMAKKVLLALLLFVAPFIVSAQEEEGEEENPKMVREVVNVMVERAKFAPPPPPPSSTDTKGKKGKKKKSEEPPPEVAPDTGNPMMPAPASEVMKRAQNWAKVKAPKYKKVNVSNSGGTITAQVVFPFKQKILNPENAVDGEIVMDVIVEAKEGKYRYTIKNIKHKAAKAGMSGGDIYLLVPECGSMKITDQTWKQIRSAAYGNIKIVTEDLKVKMTEDGEKKKDDW
jgi:hypothetical protein